MMNDTAIKELPVILVKTEKYKSKIRTKCQKIINSLKNKKIRDFIFELK
jgi:uncharacterized protein YegP (UPF0339 family)